MWRIGSLIKHHAASIDSVIKKAYSCRLMFIFAAAATVGDAADDRPCLTVFDERFHGRQGFHAEVSILRHRFKS